MKKFYVSFHIEIDDDSTTLSLSSDAHEEDVYEVVHQTLYDVDDFKVENLTVREKT
jgi:hypothetical protein